MISNLVSASTSALLALPPFSSLCIRLRRPSSATRPDTLSRRREPYLGV